MCSNKIRYTSQALQENLDRLKSAYNLNPLEILKESLADLEKLKSKMFEQIEIYFNKLKEEFTSQFNQSASKLTNFKDLEL